MGDMKDMKDIQTEFLSLIRTTQQSRLTQLPMLFRRGCKIHMQLAALMRSGGMTSAHASTMDTSPVGTSTHPCFTSSIRAAWKRGLYCALAIFRTVTNNHSKHR